MNINNVFAWFNQNLGGPIGSVIGAILIFVIGWLMALIIAAVVRGVLSRISVNQRMNASTGQQYDIEGIISKIFFWFVFVIAISMALDQLNLDAISTPFSNMISQVLTFIPSLIAAAAVTLIGWVVATLARNAISMVLSKTSMDEKLSAEAGIQPMSNTISDVAYWFILLLFIPMVLSTLGLNGLLEPISGMITKMLDFVPNIIVAGIIFAVGYIIAKILRGIVTNLIAATNVQALTAKAGMGQETSIAGIAGTIVFATVVITSLVAALNALKIDVITRPATNMIDQLLSAIPSIIGAAAILGVMYFVVRIVANIVKGLLEATPVNELPEKVGLQSVMGEYKLSDAIGSAIIFFAMLFASIAAAEFLGFTQISEMFTMFIGFGADIVLGAIIMVIGFWLANLVAGAVERSEQGSTFLANTIRVLIMGLVIAMGLKAMGIADSIVNLAFGLTLGAVAVAFAVSFGLGGQEAAARYLRNLQDKMDSDK